MLNSMNYVGLCWDIYGEVYWVNDVNCELMCNLV